MVRFGTEDHAAVAPERGADGTGPGVARVLLLPGLDAAAGDFAPGLGGVGSPAGIGQVCVHHFVDEAGMRLHAENLLGKMEGFGFFTFSVHDIDGKRH